MVEPVFPRRLYENSKHMDWGVVIPYIKYWTHPDIMSSLSPLIGWVTHRALFLNLVVTNNHGPGGGGGWGLGPRVWEHSFKYCNHPDNMSLLSPLTGWLTHRVQFFNLLVLNNHGLVWGRGPGAWAHECGSTHSIESHCYTYIYSNLSEYFRSKDILQF